MSPHLIHAYIHVQARTYIHTYIHTYTHTYIHIYIHTQIHIQALTYIHTYIHVHESYKFLRIDSIKKVQIKSLLAYVHESNIKKNTVCNNCKLTQHMQCKTTIYIHIGL